jgi:hypothetical protein
MCSLVADQEVAQGNKDKMLVYKIQACTSTKKMYPGTCASLKVLRYVPQICAHGSTAGRFMQAMCLPLLE